MEGKATAPVVEAGTAVAQPTTVETKTPVKADAAPQDVKYTVNELKAASKKQFECGPEVIDGAIYGKNETSYSVSEMKKLIEEFLHKAIKDGDE